jgi:glutamate 5-kinase
MTPSLASARRVVVKIGSALVVDEKAAAPRTAWLAGIAEDIVAPRSSWFHPAPSRWHAGPWA